MPSHLKMNCAPPLYNWLLHSPMLMQLDDAHNGQQWLRQLQPDPRALVPQTTQSHRLGSWYEQQVYQLLASSPQLRQVYRNIQVKENNRTLGEFDFLCLDHQGQSHHLECAIKFYLCDGPAAQLTSYIGPNRIDRLAKKWHQMTSRQIELGNTPAGIATCKYLGIPQPAHRYILLQGMLFYPFATTPQATCTTINAEHNRGWWARAHRLPALMTDGVQLLIRYKPDWLLDIQGNQAQPQWLTPDDCVHTPLMVSRVKQDEGGKWQEIDRGFIVQNDWGVPSNNR